MTVSLFILRVRGAITGVPVEGAAGQGISSPEDWAAIEWFREGFVTYYGYLLSLRAGLIRMPAYVESVNRDLREFPTSTNNYVRGRVIALWLDQTIRKDSGTKKSLDDVMYAMVHESAKPLTQNRIVETAGRNLSPASRTELARILKSGSRIPALDTGLGPCVHGSADEIAVFNLGFDFDASRAAGVVTGVEAGGPAYRAGLRNGQRLRGRLSVYFRQPDNSQSSRYRQTMVDRTRLNTIRESLRKYSNII